MKKLGVLVAALAVLSIPLITFAQSTDATLMGRVLDPGKATVPGASVEATNVDTNVSYKGTTDSEGRFTISDLPPGNYRISVAKPGFKSLVKPDVFLHVQDVIALNFDLPLGSVSEVVTVEGGAPLINTESAAVSTVVDRQFAENLPMNGRSFQTLIELTPGVVVTPSSLTDNGQFSVNGQRAAANYWMVDGVSANVGIGTSTFAANGLAGANAAFSALGGTNSLVSVDAMQEFRIQTSTFAPEFGRTPGGQISIATRSGTNQFHGTVFDYLRNDLFDANNWFANFNGLPKPEERQNDFGGTFGGPIVKDKMFFFFSYEGLRLRLPQVAESLVPDLSARQNAAPAMQPFLNAFPLPNGPAGTDNSTTQVAQFNASFSNSATLDAYSLRVDRKFTDKLGFFGRYNYSPSESAQRGVNNATLNSVTPSRITMQTGTVGFTWALFPTSVNDLRFNYSRTDSKSYTYTGALGGAIPPASLPFPSGVNASNAQLLLFWNNLFPYAGLNPGPQGHNLQRQINLVENLSVQKGSHGLKLGIDFRRLSPVFGNTDYFQEALFSDVPSSLSGNISSFFITSGRSMSFYFHNLGAFAQDTWRVNSLLTLTYGLRWDVDFAPSSNPAMLAVTGFDLNNLSNLALAPAGTPPFATTYSNLAPRIGMAYQIHRSQNLETVIRGGFGVFFDLATSEIGNSISPFLYPFGGANFGSGGTFPLNPNVAAPPPITPANLQVFGAGGVFDPHLDLPYSLEWNFAVEQALGAQQTLSVSHIGSVGRRLLQTAFVSAPSPTFAAVGLTSNAATSDYDALQIQFKRRLSGGLQALGSYTWSHSIDTASAGSLFGNFGNVLLPTAIQQNRGPSDFDIRNAGSIGVTYDIPARRRNAFSDAILRGWSLENVFQARSSLPVNAQSGRYSFLDKFRVRVRPNIVPGQPFYLFGSECTSTLQALGELTSTQSCPGGMALNPNAFVNPPAGQEGNLGRNALRGFGAWQWDFAVHRDFPIHESVKLQFRAELFNLLNHPNFGAPISALNNKRQFGLATQTLGSYLADGNAGGGALSPLYQIGGPRSAQFALKLFF